MSKGTTGWISAGIGVAEIVGGAFSGNPQLIIGGVGMLIGGIWGIVEAYTAKPSEPQTKVYGFTSAEPIDAREVSLPVIYGTKKSSGKIFHKSLSWMRDSETRWQVLELFFAISEGEIEDVRALRINDLSFDHFRRYVERASFSFSRGVEHPIKQIIGYYEPEYMAINQVLPRKDQFPLVVSFHESAAEIYARFLEKPKTCDVFTLWRFAGEGFEELRPCYSRAFEKIIFRTEEAQESFPGGSTIDIFFEPIMISTYVYLIAPPSSFALMGDTYDDFIEVEEKYYTLNEWQERYYFSPEEISVRTSAPEAVEKHWIYRVYLNGELKGYSLFYGKSEEFAIVIGGTIEFRDLESFSPELYVNDTYIEDFRLIEPMVSEVDRNSNLNEEVVFESKLGKIKVKGYARDMREVDPRAADYIKCDPFRIKITLPTGVDFRLRYCSIIESWFYTEDERLIHISDKEKKKLLFSKKRDEREIEVLFFVGYAELRTDIILEGLQFYDGGRTNMPYTSWGKIYLEANEEFSDGNFKFDFLVKGIRNCPNLLTDDPFANRHWSENPAEILLEFLTNKRYGAGKFISQRDIDIDSFKEIAYMVENETYIKNGVEYRSPIYGHKIGLELSALSLREIIERILSTIMGFLIFNEKIKLKIDNPNDTVVRTITMDDILVSDGRSTFRSWENPLRDRPNKIKVQFENPDMGDRRDELILTDDKAIEEDGYEKEISIQLYGIRDRSIAKKLGDYYFSIARNSRLFCEFALPIGHIDLEPGDLIEVDHDLIGKKTFRIISLRITQRDEIDLVCKEFLKPEMYVVTYDTYVDVRKANYDVMIRTPVQIPDRVITRFGGRGLLAEVYLPEKCNISCMDIWIQEGAAKIYKGRYPIRGNPTIIEIDGVRPQSMETISIMCIDRKGNKSRNLVYRVEEAVVRKEIPIVGSIELFEAGLNQYAPSKSFELKWKVKDFRDFGFAAKPAGFESGQSPESKLIEGYEVKIMDENENIIEQRIVKEPMIRFNEDSNLIKNYMQYKDTIIVEVSTVGIGGITSKPFREIFTCNKEKTKIWDGKFIKAIANPYDIRSKYIYAV